MFDLIDTKSTLNVFEDRGRQLDRLEGEIEFENVCFSYPQRSEVTVLRDLSFKVPCGKIVALVGPR